MRAPDFWWDDRPGAASALLAPAAWAYGIGHRLHWAMARPFRAAVPVLCIGNLVAGGAGKTPIAIDLAGRLASRGIAVHVISRGYGGRATGPLRIDPAIHDCHAVGDEALLLAERAPTWVAADRPAGCRAAVAAGAQAIVMDDGFQNPSVTKDVALVVVDGGRGLGNGRLLPAGPLREEPRRGLARAQAVVLMGEDVRGTAAALRSAMAPGTLLLRARLGPGPGAADLAGRKVVAFAGIGDPSKVFATLRALGADVDAGIAFPDHHPFGAAEIGRIRERAEKTGALLVTTAKDFVRLPMNMRDGIRVLTIGVEWEDEAALDAWLAPLVAGSRR